MLLFACTTHENENRRLTEELKMVREENSLLKAEILSMQKQLDELSAKVKEEREGLQRKFEEERNEMYRKVHEEREAIRKRSEEAAKRKSAALRKEAKEPSTQRNGSAPGSNGKAQKKPAVE